MEDAGLPMNIRFSEGLLLSRKKESVSQENTIQQRDMPFTKGAEMTNNWGQTTHILCCKSHVFAKSTKCKKPYVVKARIMGPSPPEVTSPLVAGRLRVFIDLEGVTKKPLGLTSSQGVENTSVSS